MACLIIQLGALPIDSVSIYQFGGFLIFISVALIFGHSISWKSSKTDATLSELERDFAWQQCRRRSQTSAMIGIVGTALMFHQLVPLNKYAVMAYIIGLIAIVIWVMILAVADVAATKNHLHKLSREALEESNLAKKSKSNIDRN